MLRLFGFKVDFCLFFPWLVSKMLTVTYFSPFTVSVSPHGNHANAPEHNLAMPMVCCSKFDHSTMIWHELILQEGRGFAKVAVSGGGGAV